MAFDKITRALRKLFPRPYHRYRSRLAIDRNLVLLEGGQGKNTNGSMLVLVAQMCKHKDFSGRSIVMSVQRSNRLLMQRKLDHHGLVNIKLVVRGSRSYQKVLAQAGLLASDNTFPPYLHKRPGQILVQTWHGTPLKTLGRSDKGSYTSRVTIQRNYAMADIALFPNKHTRTVFMRDYDLDAVFHGMAIMGSYPRNDNLHQLSNTAGATCLRPFARRELAPDTCKIYAYLPTWRGNGRTADSAGQAAQLAAILLDFDAVLGENEILYVNLHFLNTPLLNTAKFKRIRMFPALPETYQVLACCDALISDFSSVIFDFAPLKRPQVLLPYDSPEYVKTRGLYIPLETVPFPVCANAVAAIEAIRAGKGVASHEFLQTYCAHEDGYGSQRLLAAIRQLEADSSRKPATSNSGQDKIWCMIDSLDATTRQKLEQLTSACPNQQTVIICHPAHLTKPVLEAAIAWPTTVRVLAVPSLPGPTAWHKIFGFFASLFTPHRANAQREQWLRYCRDYIFPGNKPGIMISLVTYDVTLDAIARMADT